MTLNFYLPIKIISIESDKKCKNSEIKAPNKQIQLLVKLKEFKHYKKN